MFIQIDRQAVEGGLDWNMYVCADRKAMCFTVQISGNDNGSFVNVYLAGTFQYCKTYVLYRMCIQ